MRDPKRIDRMIEILRGAWQAHPDWRLGQLITNCVGDNVYYAEDDETERELRKLAKHRDATVPM